MAYNFRKEQKELYVPGKNPSLINVPMMKYLAVRGHGDPNQENSEYKKAIEKLYAVAYTIKMSKKGTYQIPDYFNFVVPPLEGLWWQDGITGIGLPFGSRGTILPTFLYVTVIDLSSVDFSLGILPTFEV